MSPGSTYDVRVWAIRKFKGKKRTTYSVRWKVGSKEWHKTFATLKQAEGHRSVLISASGAGAVFDLATGLPAGSVSSSFEVTWFDLSLDFMRIKWPDAAPKYRKSLAESLTVITTALARPGGRTPSLERQRRALYGWAYTNPTAAADIPTEHVDTIAWIRAHSTSLDALADPATLRSTLERIALTLDGRKAATSTIAKRRSALHNCLEFAVECQLLMKNPLDEIKRKRRPPTASIDRRRVANPTQARALLVAVRQHHPELEAYFATLYYSGTRPGEAINLRRTDCSLPEDGWGELLLHSSYQRPGATWVGTDSPSEERELKHRAKNDIRLAPVPPALVTILRKHIQTFALGHDGRLFVSRTGRAGRPKPPPYVDPVSANTVYRAWQRARSNALTESECNSLLAERPYDLRHACLSTWLNAGVAPTQVAEWAGHSVAVLLNVYAKCLVGQDQIAFRRIEGALNPKVD